MALAVSPRIGSFPRYQAFRFKSFMGLEESLRQPGQRHPVGLLSAARTVPSYLNQPPMSMGQRTSFTLSTDNGHSLDPVQVVRDLWPAIAEDHAFAAEGGDQHQSLEALDAPFESVW